MRENERKKQREARMANVICTPIKARGKNRRRTLLKVNEITNVLPFSCLFFSFFLLFEETDGRTELKGIRGPSRANADYC